ncbi:MAG: transglycosylase SLT domain-containing protein [Rikenellaceae bacterium]
MKLSTILSLSLITLSLSATPLSAADQFWKKQKKTAAVEALERPDTTQVTVEQQITPSPLEKISADSLAKIEAERMRRHNDSITLNFSMMQMDSLVTIWRERRADEHFDEFRKHYIMSDSLVETSIPDSVYIERLRNMMSPVILPYNDITKSYIARYTNTRYGTINRIMSLSQYYFPDIEEELLKNDIPIEFRAMPIIESALSATAVSPAGAMGLWQFMPATAKAYGLEINSLVDERCNPQLSTKAACRFIKDMYDIYGDWTLVIAAYNCGPGNVNKALARSSVSKENGTFWDIYYYLPRETRGYVPAFVGASYAYAYHQQHNIEFEESPLPLATDTIHINRALHFGQVSEVLEIPMELLRELNPQYRKDIIPATTKVYSLRLPQRYVTEYIENEELINSKDSVYLKEYINPEALKKAMTTPSYTIHQVRSGETLGAIANKYRVSTKSIINLNNLRNPDRLSVGQRLKISAK